MRRHRPHHYRYTRGSGKKARDVAAVMYREVPEEAVAEMRGNTKVWHEAT